MPSAHKGPALLKQSSYYPSSQHARGLQTLECVIHEREADTPDGMFSIRKKSQLEKLESPSEKNFEAKWKDLMFVTFPPRGELWAV